MLSLSLSVWNVSLFYKCYVYSLFSEHTSYIFIEVFSFSFSVISNIYLFSELVRGVFSLIGTDSDWEWFTGYSYTVSRNVVMSSLFRINVGVNTWRDVGGLTDFNFYYCYRSQLFVHLVDLEYVNDHPYILPSLWNLLISRYGQFIFICRATTGSLKWESIYEFCLLVYTGDFLYMLL